MQNAAEAPYFWASKVSKEALQNTPARVLVLAQALAQHVRGDVYCGYVTYPITQLDLENARLLAEQLDYPWWGEDES